MAEQNFKFLQAQHESLLQKQQGVTKNSQQEFTKEVRDFIEQAKRGGGNIPSTRERDQVRANLRYWANYIYGIEGVFPDTELAPSTVSEKRPVGNTIAFVLFIVLVLFGGIQVFRSAFNPTPPATEPPVSNETETPLPPATEPPVTTPDMATPTSVFDTVTLVALTSPENGANVLPNIQFAGVAANLKAEDSIHLLIARGDSYFPIEGRITPEQLSATGEWTLEALLYRDEKELVQPENLIIVPAVCFDQQCRDTLNASTQTGITSKGLPPQQSFRLFFDSSRVLYRNAYQAVVGTRLLYSLFSGSSYDLYYALPDGTSVKQITDTQQINEIYPQLSADGKSIIYIQLIRTAVDDYYSIRIMDSNGENDREVISRTTNVLEKPLWSLNPSVFTYTVIESRGSSTPYSSIHLYNMETNEDRSLTGEPYPFVHRHSSWLPGKNVLVFDAAISDRTRLIQVEPETLTLSRFYDPEIYITQPDIHLTEGGYLMAFISIGPEPNYFHDIYASIDPDGELPFEGTAVRLIRSTGELLDFPMLYPDGSSLYFFKHGSIYRVEYQITDDGLIALKPDSSPSGELIIETPEVGDRKEPLYLEIDYVEAFFPIVLTP